MAREMTADEVRNYHLSMLGPRLGPIYHSLANQVTWLHARWSQYRELFAHSPERIAVLNAAAGHLFAMLQDLMFENVLLDLSCLTDPPRTTRKENLSLQRLPEVISDRALAKDVRRLARAARSACAPARDWRNRTIAHRDLSLALATEADPLPGISRADVELALEAIRAVMHRVEEHYLKSQTAYEHFIAMGRDTHSLVYHLKAGLRAEEERMARFADGSWTEADLVRDKV